MGIEEFAENGEYATAAFPWETHRVEDKEAKVVISLALAADENRTYVVLLQAAPEEHDALYEKVFLPVIDALEPLVLSWGHDDEAPAGAELTTPAMLDVEVVSEHPHDPAAFTQGLLWLDGLLYESTGRAGQSTLREVDPETGEALRKVSVPEEYFAEGLALVEDRLVQLTWETGEAFVYDLETFEQTGVFTYEGEGWGLCYDGEYLFRSDGSSVISLHDPETFEVLHRGQVTFQGRPIDQLNELECVGDYLYANVWKQDYILQIDKTNGYIVGLIDASGLLGEEERAGLESAAVLNGIAYNPETGNFWITGKLWPKMFEVQFVEAEEQ
ncbi:MAG: glutaminyl-peptide cyclotransferase [Anaerolineae bacterium]|nr:glutaminyl-peptide cyclotransferase [Anaerolineae bacterium]